MCTVTCLLTLRGQDAFFAQLDHETFYFNPANNIIYDEIDKKGKVSLRYRDQWNNIVSPAYQTVYMEGDFRIYKSYLDNWDLGLSLLSDNSNDGILRNNGATIRLSYSRRFARYGTSFQELTLGTTTGAYKTNTNSKDLWFGRQYDQTNFAIDPNLASGETMLLDSRNHYSIDIGLRYRYKFSQALDITAGFAVHHINGPQLGLILGDEILDKRYLLHGNVDVKGGPKLVHNFKTAILKQGPFFMVMPAYGVTVDFPESEEVSMVGSIATRVTRSAISLQNDAVILSLGIKSRSWAGEFSYEINTSGLNLVTRGNGAMELSLNYYILSSD